MYLNKGVCAVQRANVRSRKSFVFPFLILPPWCYNRSSEKLLWCQESSMTHDCHGVFVSPCIINYRVNKQSISKSQRVHSRGVGVALWTHIFNQTDHPGLLEKYLSLSPALCLSPFSESFRSTQTISVRQNHGQASVISWLTLLLSSPKPWGWRIGTQNQHAHNGARVGVALISLMLCKWEEKRARRRREEQTGGGGGSGSVCVSEEAAKLPLPRD